jgi:formiminotetrahydrofolate cyclodeaminase
MTYGSKKHDTAEKTVTSVLPVLHKTIDQITPLIDADAMAFSNYLVAQKMPAVSSGDSESVLLFLDNLTLIFLLAVVS